MKSKTIFGCLAAALLVAVHPGIGLGQHAGFQVGIAQPQFGIPPVQAPAIVAGSAFTGRPALIVPAPQVIAPFTMPFVSTFPLVTVPNHVPFTGQTFFPVPWGVTPPPSVLLPAQHARPHAPFVRAAPVHAPVLAGTPRAEVLRRFGQPTVTVITSTGETLYFPGDVTVIIQNGQVAGPRRDR
jgi:hypothetical protein